MYSLFLSLFLFLLLAFILFYLLLLLVTDSIFFAIIWKFATVGSFSLLFLYVFFFHVLFAVLSSCFYSSLFPSFAFDKLHFLCYLLLLVSFYNPFSLLFVILYSCSYWFVSFFVCFTFCSSYYVILLVKLKLDSRKKGPQFYSRQLLLMLIVIVETKLTE